MDVNLFKKTEKKFHGIFSTRLQTWMTTSRYISSIQTSVFLQVKNTSVQLNERVLAREEHVCVAEDAVLENEQHAQD